MTDAHARQEAIDPTRSFIVQAPAGSGKTELLIQRYLKLLAHVKIPEEILAITYTRKATEEMRSRITSALSDAQLPAPESLEPHQQLTRKLALAVLAQDEKYEWQLLDFPRRLRVSTIDSFCANLVRQMPFLSRMGAMPQILEPATPIYEKAVQKMLIRAQQNDTLSKKIKRLLRHMDNNWRSIQERMVEALAARDQWLGHIVEERRDTEKSRLHMTQFLQRQVLSKRKQLTDLLGEANREQLVLLAAYAQINRPDIEGWWSAWDAVAENTVSLDALKGLKQLLFTKDGKKRKSITKTNGFPAQKDAHFEDTAFESGGDAKNACLELIDALHENSFAAALISIDNFPTPEFSDAQWEIVELLMELLYHAAVELRVVNEETGQVDFVQMALAAQDALGEEDNPTDLLLHLDHQIKHILIDEFQDTSRSQVNLFYQLVSGWLPDDGRTLFVVGDPMQSIYAFRKADVGNYLRAQEQGIGGIALERLQLQRNFRSQPGIVNWVNRVFSEVFPKEEDVILGQVSYAASVPAKSGAEENLVELHFLDDGTLKQESQRALSIIQKRLAKGMGEEEKIAVLVRSRGRLRELIPMLTQNQIPFSAVDIFELNQEPIIQDLQSLSNALHYLYDRQAWVALLRSPLCGLSLSALTTLTKEKYNLIWKQMEDEEIRKNIDPEMEKRVRSFKGIVERHMRKGPQKSLRAYVEGVFYALGGPSIYSEEENVLADVFFQVLEEMEASVGSFSKSHLSQAIANLKAPSMDTQAPVQLMTIHKSKGLEFDTVILLSLGAAPRANEYELLSHFEWCLSKKERGLLLAPIHATGADKDPIQKLIRHLRQDQERNEVKRLLYVAATRAKNNLHLIAKGSQGDKGDVKWRGNSLMAILGGPLEDLGLASLEEVEEEALQEESGSPWLRRVSSLDDVPLPQDPLLFEKQAQDSVDINMGFDASLRARHLGIVIHQYMEWIGEEGLHEWTEERLRLEGPTIERLLLKEGMSVELLPQGISHVLSALSFVLSDARGQWILGSHEEAHTEWALSYLNEQGQIENVILDRSFVDDQGVRWIIDYKTGTHEGGDLKSYLEAQKQKYQSQLEKYAMILHTMEKRPIKLGIYFPFENGFCQWDWQQSGA